eukprot:TRINITY_DN7713_c0_g1_i1.p1 TRINITY_DN7713_c0_g1~~TRINITY_DN7713_c0_g1_i1.p1  ORF type:complete len:1257 (-),score=408.21 TRINITY_DN7713_c0_g1_i1:386-4156(-)
MHRPLLGRHSSLPAGGVWDSAWDPAIDKNERKKGAATPSPVGTPVKRSSLSRNEESASGRKRNSEEQQRRKSVTWDLAGEVNTPPPRTDQDNVSGRRSSDPSGIAGRLKRAPVPPAPSKSPVRGEKKKSAIQEFQEQLRTKSPRGQSPRSSDASDTTTAATRRRSSGLSDSGRRPSSEAGSSRRSSEDLEGVRLLYSAIDRQALSLQELFAELAKLKVVGGYITKMDLAMWMRGHLSFKPRDAERLVAFLDADGGGGEAVAFSYKSLVEDIRAGYSRWTQMRVLEKAAPAGGTTRSSGARQDSARFGARSRSSSSSSSGSSPRARDKEQEDRDRRQQLRPSPSSSDSSIDRREKEEPPQLPATRRGPPLQHTGQTVATPQGGGRDRQGGEKKEPPPLNARVHVTLEGRRCYGQVKYVGKLQGVGKDGQWVGIELDSPRGKNDGCVGGHRYFSCSPQYGLFCRPVSVEEASEAASSEEGGPADGDDVLAPPRQRRHSEFSFACDPEDDIDIESISSSQAKKSAPEQARCSNPNCRAPLDPEAAFCVCCGRDSKVGRDAVDRLLQQAPSSQGSVSQRNACPEDESGGASGGGQPKDESDAQELAARRLENSRAKTNTPRDKGAPAPLQRNSKIQEEKQELQLEMLQEELQQEKTVREMLEEERQGHVDALLRERRKTQRAEEEATRLLDFQDDLRAELQEMRLRADDAAAEASKASSDLSLQRSREADEAFAEILLCKQELEEELESCRRIEQAEEERLGGHNVAERHMVEELKSLRDELAATEMEVKLAVETADEPDREDEAVVAAEAQAAYRKAAEQKEDLEVALARAHEEMATCQLQAANAIGDLQERAALAEEESQQRAAGFNTEQLLLKLSYEEKGLRQEEEQEALRRHLVELKEREAGKAAAEREQQHAEKDLQEEAAGLRQRLEELEDELRAQRGEHQRRRDEEARWSAAERHRASAELSQRDAEVLNLRRAVEEAKLEAKLEATSAAAQDLDRYVTLERAGRPPLPQTGSCSGVGSDAGSDAGSLASLDPKASRRLREAKEIQEAKFRERIMGVEAAAQQQEIQVLRQCHRDMQEMAEEVVTRDRVIQELRVERAREEASQEDHRLENLGIRTLIKKRDAELTILRRQLQQHYPSSGMASPGSMLSPTAPSIGSVAAAGDGGSFDGILKDRRTPTAVLEMQARLAQTTAEVEQLRVCARYGGGARDGDMQELEEMRRRQRREEDVLMAHSAGRVSAMVMSPTLQRLPPDG